MIHRIGDDTISAILILNFNAPLVKPARNTTPKFWHHKPATFWMQIPPEYATSANIPRAQNTPKPSSSKKITILGET
jgi:hypothetical protein